MIYVDAHAVIGNAHRSGATFMQDYAEAHQHDKAWQLAVSDGCSSGGKTDVGARLLSRLAMRVSPSSEEFLRELIALQSLLGLNENDLLSTLLFAEGVSRSAQRVLVWGDGAVYERYLDGTERFTEIYPSQNMPVYPVYALASHGQIDSLRDTLGEVPVIKREVIYSENEVYTNDEELSLNEVLGGISINPLNDSELDMLALFSDGVGSSNAESLDLARDLTRFATRQGRFVGRKLTAGLRKLQRRGIIFADDLAMSAVVCDDEKENGNDTKKGIPAE